MAVKSSFIYQNHFSHHAVNINFGIDSVLVPVLSGNLRNCSFFMLASNHFWRLLLGYDSHGGWS